MHVLCMCGYFTNNLIYLRLGFVMYVAKRESGSHNAPREQFRSTNLVCNTDVTYGLVVGRATHGGQLLSEVPGKDDLVLKVGRWS